jgi:hypothetical protein
MGALIVFASSFFDANCGLLVQFTKIAAPLPA